MNTLASPSSRWLIAVGVLLGAALPDAAWAQLRPPELPAYTLAVAHPLGILPEPAAPRVRGPGWVVPVAVGSILGGVGTYAWLHSGGSTSHCDRSANQDAMSRGECAGLTLVGAAAGAGLGVLVSKLLRTEEWAPARLGHVSVSFRGW